MNVYVLMDPTGSSWKYTFFFNLGHLPGTCCMSNFELQPFYLTLESIHLLFVVCIWILVQSWTPEKRTYFTDESVVLSSQWLVPNMILLPNLSRLHLNALNLRQLRNCPNCKDFSAVKVGGSTKLV